MIQRHDSASGTSLSKIVGVPDRPHASTNIERDAGTMMARYIPNSSFVEAVNIFAARLGKGVALSIIGPYGSGKSTFGVVLGHLAAPHDDPGWKAAHRMLRKAAPDVANNMVAGRRRAGLERGMIRCVATARLEPVAATVLRAAANGAVSYFGARYGRKHFAEAGALRRCTKSLQRGVVPDVATISRILSDMAAAAPVLLLIDEFGKNVEYFADGGSEGDLFLLQDLAEMTGASRGVRLHIVTMQHMALGEYVAGSSAARIKEWAKIQGRFESVHFANSLEHTKALLSSFLSGAGSSGHILEWADEHAKMIAGEAGVEIPADIAASCYPLHPLAVEALPELCSRYGQNDRTLLSFVFGSGPGTVARFVETTRWGGLGALPTMGADQLYDYFISGSAPANAGAASQSSRLVEIDTIVRDTRISDKTEMSTLKAIGLLNLIGRSGRLRASMGIIRCMVGRGAGQAVKSLESRSVITYRRHADEYRIWHGTDVNIAAKVAAMKNVIKSRPYPDLMKAAITPEPVIAARHGLETGTLRVFASLFKMPESGVGPEYDGVMIYGTEYTTIPTPGKPALVSRCRDVSALADAAADVAALRSVLSDSEVADDWVAKIEVDERLAAAMNALNTEFDRAYGPGANWTYLADGEERTISGTASSAASEVSDAAYPDTPVILNETINRNRLTAQGSMALNQLMHAMIANEGEKRLGLEGWRPERAIYEVVMGEHNLHRQMGSRYRFLPPNGKPRGKLKRAWSAAIYKIKSHKTVMLQEIYNVWKMPPYGIRDGVMPILVLHIILAKRGKVAVYEHGTYIPRVNASVAERLVKNPGHFSLKYYRTSKRREALIQSAAESLRTDPENGMLGIVGYLVSVVRALPNYTRKTKNISGKALAVRDAVQRAVEPDTLLFESLPEALDIDILGGGTNNYTTREFAEGLAHIINEIQAAFDLMMVRMSEMLLMETDMPDRASLSKTASELLQDVSDQRMKVFLGAVSVDIPDDKAWINYVGLTLTDVPPADWCDEHEKMFANNLRDATAGLRRLEALRFATVSNNMEGSPVMVTITHPDGGEERVVLPANDERLTSLTDLYSAGGSST